jgi:hypothetical protein
MTTLADNDEFKGSVNDTLRHASMSAGSAALEVKSGDAWVQVKDGALVGPAEFTFYCPSGCVMRFTSVVGGLVEVSG